MLTPLEIEDFRITNLESLVARLSIKSKLLGAANVLKIPNLANIKTLTEDIEKLKNAILNKQSKS